MCSEEYEEEDKWDLNSLELNYWGVGNDLAKVRNYYDVGILSMPISYYYTFYGLMIYDTG